jgi:hypothetical protein
MPSRAFATSSLVIPAQAGIQFGLNSFASDLSLVRPAYAGTQHAEPCLCNIVATSFPRRRESSSGRTPSRATCHSSDPHTRESSIPSRACATSSLVIPAQAGIQRAKNWIPACAGMTD